MIVVALEDTSATQFLNVLQIVTATWGTQTWEVDVTLVSFNLEY
jgi:hypothetical protein